MPKKRINPDRNLTPAEKSERYRQRYKAMKKELETLAAPPSPAPDMAAADAESLAAIREQIIAEYEASRAAQWKAETQAERIKATRKAAREKEQGKYYRRGFVHSLCRAALFFEKRGRHDIALELLKEFNIEQADFENPDNDIHKLLADDLQRYGLYEGKINHA